MRLLGGGTALLDGDIDRSGPGGYRGDAAYDPGFLAGAAVGYRLDQNWSVDLEFLYRTNDISSLRDRAGGDTIPGAGDFSSATLMADVYYRFRAGSRTRPYVGLGLGWVEEIDVDFEQNGEELGFSDTGLAFQAMAGLDLALDQAWSLQIEGRYTRAFDFELESEAGPAGRIDADYDQLGLVVGLAYRF